MRKGTMQVFDAWRKGERFALATRALWTDGESIFSYDTAILAKVPSDLDDAAVVLNRTDYSITTTIHQNGLAVLLGYESLTVYEVGSQAFGVEPSELVRVAYSLAA